MNYKEEETTDTRPKRARGIRDTGAYHIISYHILRPYYLPFSIFYATTFSAISPHSQKHKRMMVFFYSATNDDDNEMPILTKNEKFD